MTNPNPQTCSVAVRTVHQWDWGAEECTLDRRQSAPSDVPLARHFYLDAVAARRRV